MAYQKMNKLEEKVPVWVESGFSSKEDIDLIEDFGKHIADWKQNRKGKWVSGNDAISTSQIRIVYGEITRLKMQPFNEMAVLMLRPKMAYAAARQKTTYKDLQEVISLGIDSVSKSNDKKKAFYNLSNILEAILAYHKAHGGS